MIRLSKLWGACTSYTSRFSMAPFAMKGQIQHTYFLQKLPSKQVEDIPYKNIFRNISGIALGFIVLGTIFPHKKEENLGGYESHSVEVNGKLCTISSQAQEDVYIDSWKEQCNQYGHFITCTKCSLLFQHRLREHFTVLSHDVLTIYLAPKIISKEAVNGQFRIRYEGGMEEVVSKECLLAHSRFGTRTLPNGTILEGDFSCGKFSGKKTLPK